MINLLKKIQKIKLTPKVYLKLPDNPGVYIYFKNNSPIYIGKAINLKRRVASYFRLNLETKTRKMVSEAEEIGFIKVSNDLEALLLEAKLIKLYLPKYNVISKDDKHPLYIIITKEVFPRIITARKTDTANVPSLATYGPFPSSTNVKSVLKMIRKIIPYSDHKIGRKPCLYSQIGLCDPCPNEIVYGTEYLIHKKIYLKNIRHIKAILDGKSESLIKELSLEMNKFSKEESYETAMELRNKIQKLTYITNSGTVVDSYLENPNFAEDVRQGELSELKNILIKHKLLVPKLHRIECFDVAHLAGSNATASMVTFIDGESDKTYYRHFRIIQKNRQDDYRSMREVAERRKKHFDDWGKPDLIIVDGGKGQLSVFLDVFREAKIPIIGLAKRFETLVIPAGYLGVNSFYEHRLLHSPALNLVQKIRNEAHRFAQGYHHKLVKQTLFESKK